MKTILSLRARIFIGAVFWMAALFIAAGMLLTHCCSAARVRPFFFHRIFVHWTSSAPDRDLPGRGAVAGAGAA